MTDSFTISENEWPPARRTSIWAIIVATYTCRVGGRGWVRLLVKLSGSVRGRGGAEGPDMATQVEGCVGRDLRRP